MTPRNMVCRPMAVVLVGLGLCCTVSAQDSPVYKLTYGSYRYDGFTGQDLNLRWRRHDSDAWVGVYQDAQFGSQWRGGYDTSVALNDWLQVQPTVQVASRGFVGGSVALQADNHTWYGVVGWGRTNLRPYFNLNFDPNDAITLGGGWHDEAGHNVALTVIADDRLATGQRDTHATVRWPLTDGDRLTVDLLNKRGQGDSGPVRAWGWTASYDFPRWFFRVARDPKQNFSPYDALRLSTGVRF